MAATRGYDDRLRRRARLAAAFAQWVGTQDPAQLVAAFRRVGLEVRAVVSDHHYVHQYYGRHASELRSGLDDGEFRSLADDVAGQKRTLLYYDRLHTLYQAVRNCARQFPSGTLQFLEAGVYRGGSSYFLARVAEHVAGDRVRLVSVDTFEGHSEEDLPTGQEGAHTPETFTRTSVEEVREYLSRFSNVEVRQGRLQDVAPSLAGALHLFHLDVDLYAPTRYGLELAAERLLPGGTVVVDDYRFASCPGVTQAMEEFLEDHGERFFVHALDTGQALVVRTR